MPSPPLGPKKRSETFLFSHNSFRTLQMPQHRFFSIQIQRLFITVYVKFIQMFKTGPAHNHGIHHYHLDIFHIKRHTVIPIQKISNLISTYV